MVNGKFQGANVPDFSGAVDLFVISNAPTEGAITVQVIPNHSRLCTGSEVEVTLRAMFLPMKRARRPPSADKLKRESGGPARNEPE